MGPAVSAAVRCLELFAGAGGAALGLERAGFEHAALVEWNADACATLRAAGLGPVVEGDVRDLERIAAAAGPGSVDLLWSSFPCQAFSQAGKRLGASDERNGWPWTVAAVDRFTPTWFLAENVRGLLSHSAEHCGDSAICPGCYFHGTILPELRERFACVGWWLLDAADHGVPQHRRRVIIWAGPRLVAKPEPTHGSPTECRQTTMWGPKLQPWVSMGEALGIVGTSYLIGRPSPTVVRSEVKGSGPGANPEKLQRASDALFLATGRRRLTVEECARLQDFPTEHPFQGTKTSRYVQVGNAVPPTLAEVCGRAIIAAALRP